MSAAQRILKQVFGHDRFRGPQEAIIEHVLAGGDALVLLPTGGGKSLCYQIPALLRPGVGIVISPLIALMRDQAQALSALGVRAACLHSGLSPDTARAVTADLVAGRLDLLYTAPERFMTPAFQALLDRVPLALFAIDEAHCVSQWGHDFRPHYLELAVIPERYPGVPRLALTATADAPTRADILDRLRLPQARVFATGFDRPNIRYLVEPKDHPRQRLLRFLTEDHAGQSGIVYRLSRKKVDDLAAGLAARGVPALAYHAGLSPEERDRRQDRFMKEDGLVMVATVAFGMGVDKPDVRFVVHMDPPKSLEAYHQETGRAGRDGEPAEALLLYAPADFALLRRLIVPNDDEGPRTRIDLAKLDALIGYCEADTCRRQALLGYFGQDLPAPCGNCDICLNPVEPVDATIPAQKALSCVFRTGQRFGAGHLTDVLLGKTTARVLRFGHDQVSTFGIGGELTVRQWGALFRRLAAMGALSPVPDAHGGWQLTPLAWDILKGRRGLTMRLPAEPEPGAPRARRQHAERKSWADEHLDTPQRRALWERLRAWRTATAAEAGVPPYVVFHDRTLLDIVLRRPGNPDELATTEGMGRVKLQRYGPALLAILAEFPAAPDQPPAGPEPVLPPDDLTVQPPGESAEASLALFRTLKSVAVVAAARGLTEKTVVNHLLSFVARGELPVEALVDLPGPVRRCLEETILAVRQAGQLGLRPVYDALSGEIDYETLRLLEAGLAAAGRFR